MATYPIFSQQDLLRAFADEYPELKLRDDDFNSPQKLRWQHIYMTLLSLMTDTLLPVLNSNFYRAIKDVEYVDVHNEGLGLCLLTKAMQKKLEKAAVNNFYIKDIVQPSQKRLCTIMSAILNYLRYKLACNDDFRNMKSKLEDRKTHYEGLKKENDVLIGKINTFRAAQAQQEPKITKAREENELKKRHAAEVQVQANVWTATREQMKTKASDLKASLAKHSEEIASMKQEVDGLDVLIVHSPERAAQERAIMEEKLEQMRARKEDKLRRLAEMKASRLLHRSFEGERACELLKGISRIKEREREAVKQMKGLQNEKQQLHAEFVEVDDRKQLLQRNVVSRQEKIDKAVLQHRVKEDSVKCQLHELQKTVEKLDAKDDRVRALEEEQRDVQQKIEAQRREFAERQELLKGDHEMMLSAVTAYNKMLEDEFNSVMAGCDLLDFDNN